MLLDAYIAYLVLKIVITFHVFKALIDRMMVFFCVAVSFGV